VEALARYFATENACDLGRKHSPALDRRFRPPKGLHSASQDYAVMVNAPARQPSLHCLVLRTPHRSIRKIPLALPSKVIADLALIRPAKAKHGVLETDFFSHY
jgi:hypothetical protein